MKTCCNIIAYYLYIQEWGTSKETDTRWDSHKQWLCDFFSTSSPFCHVTQCRTVTLLYISCLSFSSYPNTNFLSLRMSQIDATFKFQSHFSSRVVSKPYWCGIKKDGLPLAILKPSILLCKSHSWDILAIMLIVSLVILLSSWEA